MSNEIITFGPDGDLHLLLTYPPAKAVSTQHGPGSAKTSTDGGYSKASALGGGSELTTDATAEFPETARKVEMLVSSKHLMLSSPVLKAMLQPGSFAEGSKLQAGGKLDSHLSD
ncbi:hypothetical protein DL98DRAFT_527733 [Cadophora sp. DSE1049]|nr:hypothetical protein DL98DRAFT_527733 [Cadophora sp. DSE1049]